MRNIFNLSRSGFLMIIFVSVSISFLMAGKPEPVNRSSQIKVVLDNHVPTGVVIVQQKYSPQFINMPDVIGTAIGLTEDGKECILILTKTEIAYNSLPDQIENIPVRIMVTGDLSEKEISQIRILMPSLFTGC